MHKIIPNTLFVGQSLVYLPQCHSTNQIAQDYPSEHPNLNGLTVITGHQTAGRGQRGATWETQAGQNITLSLILLPDFLPIVEQFYLTIITSLAVRELMAPYLDPSLKIKWPNDLVYQNQKLCGILIENSIRDSTIERSIIGIGLNVNQELFTYPRATSLRNLTGQKYVLENLIQTLLEKVEEKYLLLQAKAYQELKSDYIQHLLYFEEKKPYRIVETGKIIEGILIDVNHQGQLILEADGQIQNFGFKEVAFLYEGIDF